MTVDVEDYFHVSVFDGTLPRHQWGRLESRVGQNTDRLLQLFESAGIRATFFVLGWVAERWPALVRRIASLGHEIASHGYAHRLAYDQTPTAFRDDVRRAKALLEDASCRPVIGFRAPSYSITPRSLWALDVLIGEGYLYDASIFPIRHDRYGIPLSARHAYRLARPAGTIIEMPASTVRYGPLNLPVAGGGYFRLFPPMVMRAAVRQAEKHPDGVPVLYFHPWEFDPDQPRLPLGRAGRFRTYVGIKRGRSRLRDLLSRYESRPMIDAADDLGLRILPTFRLGEPVEVAARAAA